MKHAALAVMSCLLWGFASAPLQAGQGEVPAAVVTAGTEIVGTTRYVWRGFDDGRGFSLQPNAWVEFRGLKVSSWFNLTAGPRPGDPTLTEQDLAIAYLRSWGAVEVTGGWTAMLFPGSPAERFSHEAFVSVRYAGPLTPWISLHRDFRMGDGTYVSAGAGHKWADIAPRLDLALTGRLGYNDHQWTPYSGWSDAEMRASLTWRPAGGRLAFSPFMSRSVGLDSRIVRSRSYGGIEIALR